MVGECTPETLLCFYVNPMPFLAFLIIIPFIVLSIYFAWYNSAEQKGKRGEMYVFSILSQLPDEYTVLNDLVFRTEKGTTQIDHVVVSTYGVFAIETKNYRGEIYGDDNRKEWTQMIITDVTYSKKWWKTYTYVTKNHFYNPVKQSLAHCYAIKNKLSQWPALKIVPIVVFAGEAVLKDVKSNYHVVYDFRLIETIMSYRTVYLSDAEVRNVVDALLQKNVRESVENSEHINNIYVSKARTDYKILSGICPKCGGKLVMRNGKYGRFYGCSNYPRCRFTT